MIIDTESPEGTALVALAKFGEYALAKLMRESPETDRAIELGLIKATDGCTLTDLAKLPEGL